MSDPQPDSGGEVADGSAQVETFVAMTGCDPQHAGFLLEASGWDLDAAVQLFFEQAAPEPAPLPRPAPRQPPPRPNPSLNMPPPPRPLAPAQRNHLPAHTHPRGGAVGLLGLATSLPVLLLRTGLHAAVQALALSFATVTFLGDRLLPRAFMRGIRGAFRAFLGRSQEPDPTSQACTFIQQFRNVYGELHPPFVPLGVKQASIQARAQHRFLFVYLHSPEHQDTDLFCRSVLCSSDLIDLLSQQFVCWGGDVRRSDAYLLCVSLGATTYPFTAVLSMGPDNKVSLVSAAQGCVVLQPGMLHTLLSTAMADHGALLVAQRADMQEQDMNRRLVHEQNAEYEASLEADRQRDRLRQQERERQEAERRTQEESEARVRAEQEAAEQRSRERAAAIAQRREAKRAVLPPAPPPGSGSPESPTILVRVRLPDGSNAQRSFPPGSTLGTVYDFVDSLDSTNYWKYNLVSSYPRRVYSPESSVLTLDALGLGTQVALFVQPEDEEEGEAS